MGSLGSRLREKRLEMNFTLRGLADAIGSKSHQTIHNIELGRQSASLPQIEALAAALNVSPCWLAFGKKE